MAEAEPAPEAPEENQPPESAAPEPTTPPAADAAAPAAGEDPTTPPQVLLPEEVTAMGAYLGVNLEAGEHFLLAVAKEAVVSAVKPPWEELEDEKGNPYFFNHRTRASTRRHPLDAKFLKLVHAYRDSPPDGAKGRTWMRFTRAEGGEAYWVNFAAAEGDAKEAEECPADQEILSVPEADVPVYDEADLVGGEGSGYIHHRRALAEEIAVNDTRVLTFKSWWYEDKEEPSMGNGMEVGAGLARRYVTVNFNIESQTFELHMDNDQEISLYNLTSVTAKNGLPVECWDLHIGAKLNLLGKSTTLLQGSMATVRWLEHHTKRLKKVKAELERQLKKYSTSALPISVTYSKGVKQRGGASLRALMDQTEELRLMLARFRPKLADQIAVEVADIMGYRADY